MSRAELKQLLRKIGARLGLKFDAGAIEEIWLQTGGHPWLAREYGRLIDRKLAPEKRVHDGVVVERGHVRDLFARYAVEVEMTMEEFQRAATDVDKRSVAILGDLAAADTSATQSLAGLPDAAIEELRRLGLIAQASGGHWHIVIGVFKTWLLRNAPRPKMERVG